jgi:hypothetical protein
MAACISTSLDLVAIQCDEMIDGHVELDGSGVDG